MSHAVAAGSPHAQGEAKQISNDLNTLQAKCEDASKRYMDQTQAKRFSDAELLIAKARRLLDTMPS